MTTTFPSRKLRNVCTHALCSAASNLLGSQINVFYKAPLAAADAESQKPQADVSAQMSRDSTVGTCFPVGTKERRPTGTRCRGAGPKNAAGHSSPL